MDVNLSRLNFDKNTGDNRSEAFRKLDLNTADIQAALSSIGNAATRNVGNTQGTVAAGDDPRFGHGFRNRVINGAFDIWQRGTAGFVAGYSADRWRGDSSGSTMTMSRQAFAAGDAGQPTGHGLYFMRVTVNSVAGANNYAILRQFIENLSLFSGKTVTLSLWVRAPAAGAKLSSDLQLFNTSGNLSAGAMPAAQLITATNAGWTKYTLTYVMPDFAGLGISDGSALILRFAFDAGASVGLPVGQQSLAYMDLYEIQLEPGVVATSFEKRPYGLELQLCQRFFEKSFDADIAPAGQTAMYSISGVGYSGTAVQGPINYKGPKRANASVILYSSNANTSVGQSAWCIYNSQGVWSGAGSMSIFGNTKNGFTYNLNYSGGIAFGTAYVVSGHWVADAEF
jgi:hypothetical protein